MTWTWTSNGVVGTTADPDRAEVHTEARRQVRSESDGSQVWVQDLPVTDKFLELRWTALDITELSDLKEVFRAARWQADPITINVAGTKVYPVGIAPDQEILGIGVSPDQGFSPGDTVKATQFSLSVSLDQSQAAFTDTFERFGGLPLRFRILTSAVLQAGA